MKPEFSFLLGAWSLAGGIMASMSVHHYLQQRRSSRDREWWNRKLSSEVLKAHRSLDRSSRLVESVGAALVDFNNRVERLYWRFAHRKSCGFTAPEPADGKVVRKELLDQSLITLSEMDSDDRALATTGWPNSYFWNRRVYDVRLRCRKCGRLNFQQFYSFTRVSHE